MNDPRRERIMPYLRHIMNLMGLTDWLIDIAASEPPSSQAAIAELKPSYGRRHAILYLSETFIRGTPEDQRHALCHELVHCHLHPAFEIVHDGLPDDAWPGFLRMFEYGVDAIAMDWAGSLPLMLNPPIDPATDFLLIEPEPPEMASLPRKTAKPATAPKKAAPAAKGKAGAGGKSKAK